MENASKALIMAGGVLIGVLIFFGLSQFLAVIIDIVPGLF